MGVRIAIVNEAFEPLASVEVEAYDASTDTITETATSDTGGIVEFADVPFPLESTLFRPRITRGTDQPPKDPMANTWGMGKQPGESDKDYIARMEGGAEEREGESTSPKSGTVHIQLLGSV